MTRDEAIAKAEEALGFKTGQAGAQSIEARKFVDMAVALGMLKLDGPMIAGNIIVACVCGWQGQQSELNGNLCPKCSAPFKAWP